MRRLLLAAPLLLALAESAAAEPSIASSRHNFSPTGPNGPKATNQNQVCVFCHLPHRVDGNQKSYTPAGPNAPSAATRTCLSCHDGLMASGQTLMARSTIAAPGTPAQDEGRALRPLAPRQSHAVSLAPGPLTNTQPPRRGEAVRLDAQGRVSCTSCHDPHREGLDPVQGKFLVKSNRSSAICLSCHRMEAWLANPSVHQSSTQRFDVTVGAETGYGTVAENGCASCHRPHRAAPDTHLLAAPEAQVCFRCHAGRVAAKDVRADFFKPYTHPVLTSDPRLHDVAEGPSNPAFALPERQRAAPRHVLCADCHDAHAAFARPAQAPNASGALANVWGIDRSGGRVAPAQFEYEICFKCHGPSANQPQAQGPTPPESLRRAIIQTDLSRVFDVGAASYHPVEAPGRNPDVPSLIRPLTTSSVIYCSDCHSSDSGRDGPRGPHGSIYRHLLERNLSTADRTPESPKAYALCYKCHDRNVLLSDRSSFTDHARYVIQERTPCTACHDSHGIDASQGSPMSNARLINFDVSIVKPNKRGVLRFMTAGYRSGSCSLACHGKEHDNVTYAPGRYRPRIPPVNLVPMSPPRPRRPVLVPKGNPS